jgi:hypothetical protein
MATTVITKSTYNKNFETITSSATANSHIVVPAVENTYTSGKIVFVKPSSFYKLSSSGFSTTIDVIVQAFNVSAGAWVNAYTVESITSSANTNVLVGFLTQNAIPLLPGYRLVYSINSTAPADTTILETNYYEQLS